MSFAALSAYIRPEYPQYTENEGSLGNVWHYRGPTATLVTNRPAIGDAWADGRSVRSVEYTPNLDNAAISDLIVSSVFSYTDSVTLSSSLDSTRYQIRWVPQDLPLVQHPEIAPGMADPAEKAAIFGWEAEISQALKSDRKFRDVDSNGVAYGPEYTVATTIALNYVKLRELGFDSYTVFLPVWTKVGVYSGTEAPGVGSAGEKETPDGSGYPSGYEWIKSADSAERIGTRAKWQRTEEWTGFVKVYYDTTALYL